MAEDSLPAAVRRAFGLHGEAERLPGGTGQSMRVSNVVLKPGADAHASWYAEVLSALPQRGFRLAEPVRALDGRFVVDGWTAHRWVAGTTDPKGRWLELLRAARAFHAALVGIPAPAFLSGPAEQDHPWAIADQVAWDHPAHAGGNDVADVWLPLTFRSTYDALITARRPLAATWPAQLVHGDLSGNVLFASGCAPAIIDFSPYWRPVGYAEAIVAVDAMTWHATPAEEIVPLLAAADRRQLLLRATLFRLVTLAQFTRSAAGKDGPVTDLGEPAAAAAERRRFEATAATVLALPTR